MRTRAAVHLTKRRVDDLRYEGRITTTEVGRRVEPRCVRWDLDEKGLGVRVYPSGRKVWVFAYETDGRKRLIQLGEYPTLTLDKARKVAAGHRGRIATAEAVGADEIPDPLAEREARRKGETVKHLSQAFLTQHVDGRLRPTTAKEYRRQLETHVEPRWGARLAKTVTRADVAKLHVEIGQRAPTQANRTVAAVSKMFGWGRLHGYLPDDFVNPAQGIERNRETKRDRWVQAEELPRVAAAIDQEPNVYLRAFFWLVLFTGLRRTEARLLKWSDVDIERAEIRLEETKAHRTHVVPLSDPAKALLSDLPRLDGNEYVFPSLVKEKQPVGDVNKCWDRIRKAAGVPDVRVHDLRRSLGSWLASYGSASLPLIGAILNHSSPQTTQIYARLAEDPRRKALEEHGKRIMEAAQGIRVVK